MGNIATQPKNVHFWIFRLPRYNMADEDVAPWFPAQVGHVNTRPKVSANLNNRTRSFS